MDSFYQVILFHFFHNQNYNYVVQEVYVMNNKNYHIYNQNLKRKFFFTNSTSFLLRFFWFIFCYDFIAHNYNKFFNYEFSILFKNSFNLESAGVCSVLSPDISSSIIISKKENLLIHWHDNYFYSFP